MDNAASRHPILLSLLLPFILPAMAATPAPAALPAVDFSRMGAVGLGGSFAGLDWWTDQNPFSSSSSSASTSPYSSNGDTVFVRAGDGSYRPIGVTNTGGKVQAVCWAGDRSSGTVYVGGSFTSIGGQTAANIAAYSTSSSSWRSIASGLAGSVSALYCDSDNQQVWMGGQFANPNGNGTNIALWSTSSSSWQTVPFNGLNGAVTSISSNSANNHLFFSGAFTTSYGSTINTTSTNYTSVPSAPSNTSTIGNSGYLTPVTLPASSSAQGSLTITAGPSTEDSRYNDPRVLLCPGSGTWLAGEGQVSDINLLGYNFWQATGARVSNSQVEGRGTTTFCITSIPDNEQLNMTYTDPVTGKNASCWDHCPLSTDGRIGGQDFLFTHGPRNMTGLQMQLKTWTGDGAGLSSIQLLSPGGFASALSDGNSGVCPGAVTSNVQTTGSWTQGTVSTSLPATTVYFIKSTTPSPATSHPSVTFYPRVSSAGYYDVYLTIPACSKTEDCGSRTTTDIEVFPTADGLGWTSTISQVTEVDERVLVYSGWMDASDSDFSPTVILALAQNPTGTSTGSYSVVAQSVELVLIGVGNPGETPRTSPGGIVGQNGTLVTNTTRSSTRQATSFGVFEWARGGRSVNAASGLPNTTETSLSKLGYAIGSARNQSTSTSSWSVNAVVPVGNTLYAAGQFSQSGNWSNVIAVDSTSNATSALPNGGLNGPVYAAVGVGSAIYFGGNFTGTATGGVPLRYLAKFDTPSRAWSAVGGGVDGTVTDMAVNNNLLLISGNFTQTIGADGSTTSSGGYAVYDTSSSAWSASGIVFGTVAAIAPSSNGTYLAGRVYGSSGNGVNGIAMLSTGSSGAEISSLPGVSFASSGPPPSTPSRRSLTQGHHQPRTPGKKSWMKRLSAVLAPAHVSHERDLTARAPAPSIPANTNPAPAVLAGGFWTNSSASGRPLLTIMGGNFSTNNNIGGLAFYNPSTSALSGPVPPVQGVVRSLAVIGDTVYAAGSGVNVTGVGSGLVAYDLAGNKWSANRIPALNPPTGQSLVVNSIKRREDTNTVVVAGNFASAGSLSCASLCLWDSSAGQWSLPGSGLSSGEVRSIDFAGENHDTLIAAGSFVLSSGANAYVASYSFTSREWTALGFPTGPALAVAVDNKNASSIFASGYAGSDNSPYLIQWTGTSWSVQDASLLPGSVVSQLAFVPLQSEHNGTGLIERDRMLMMSGNLNLASGNATSALYDGSRTYPYLVGTTSSGGLGAASSLFWSESSFDFAIRRYLAVGLVVLIAIAIATGLILLLILIFLLVSYCLRRRERPAAEMYNKDPADMDAGSTVSSTHQGVLHTVQNAIQATLIGSGAAAAASSPAGARHRSRDPRDSGYSHYPDDPSVAGGGAAAGLAGVGAVMAARGAGGDSEGEEEEEDGDAEPRETTMRYDFDGPELQPGEMSMRAGQKVVVLDDRQSEEWWFCRDPASGREGVVPATYVW